jgi:hypothetical protein
VTTPSPTAYVKSGNDDLAVSHDTGDVIGHSLMEVIAVIAQGCLEL